MDGVRSCYHEEGYPVLSRPARKGGNDGPGGVR